MVVLDSIEFGESLIQKLAGRWIREDDQHHCHHRHLRLADVWPMLNDALPRHRNQLFRAQHIPIIFIEIPNPNILAKMKKSKCIHVNLTMDEANCRWPLPRDRCARANRTTCARTIRATNEWRRKYSHDTLFIHLFQFEFTKQYIQTNHRKTITFY